MYIFVYFILQLYINYLTQFDIYIYSSKYTDVNKEDNIYFLLTSY